MNTIVAQARDKAATCRQWVAAQENAIELRYSRIGPGQEWLRDYPKGWAIQINGMNEQSADIDAEIVNTCLALPADTPEPILQGEIFAGLLRRSDKVVLPDFDLAGHWVYGGRFRWQPAAAPEADEATVKRILAKHPRRSFGTRWDHAAPDTEEFIRIGIGGLIRKTGEQLSAGPAVEERHFLSGVKLELEAFSNFVAGHAEAAEKAGKSEIAASLRHIALAPPCTFFEALQLIWLRFVVFNREGRSAMAFGRLDRHLYPFYAADLAAGRLTREKARELLCEMFSYVYWTNTAAITIGGRMPDGCEGSNEVSLLILETALAMRVPMVSLFALFNAESPKAYLEACSRLILAGGGMPAMLNEKASLKQLAAIGIKGKDAMRMCFTGCAHLFVEGLQVPWRESCLVLPDILMAILKELSGLPEAEVSYERIIGRLHEAIRANVRDNCEEYNRGLEQVSSKNSPDLFFSAFTGDCIARRREHNDGGARYKGVIGLSIYGTAMAADILMALKKLVFEERRFTFKEVIAAAAENFENREPMRRQLLRGAPKYGNDNDEVDAIAARLVEMAADECRRQNHLLKDGSVMRLIFPGTASYVVMGKNMQATPDGRRAGEPLSDSGSPMAGRDINGLSSMLNSLARVNHEQFNGMALNVRINSKDFKGEQGLKRFLAILKVMRLKGIQELQFNCISNQELREAQRAPESHGNLLIRVAGYSARFTGLNRDVQEAIIARQEHS